MKKQNTFKNEKQPVNYGNITGLLMIAAFVAILFFLSFILGN